MSYEAPLATFYRNVKKKVTPLQKYFSHFLIHNLKAIF